MTCHLVITTYHIVETTKYFVITLKCILTGTNSFCNYSITLYVYFLLGTRLTLIWIVIFLLVFKEVATSRCACLTALCHHNCKYMHIFMKNLILFSVAACSFLKPCYPGYCTNTSCMCTNKFSPENSGTSNCLNCMLLFDFTFHNLCYLSTLN